LFERLQSKYSSECMVRYTWIVFGAVACGTATATVLGGTSPWGMSLTVIMLAGALAATAVARLMRQPTESPIKKARLERQQLEQERFDHDLVARVHELVTEREIDWLRHEDFDGAWRDTPVSSLRNLKRSDALASARFADDLGEAVARLAGAINGFLDYYELNTRPDDLLTGTDWREVGPSTTAGERPDGLQPPNRVQEHLVERAAAVTRAYDSLPSLQPAAKHPAAGRTRA